MKAQNIIVNREVVGAQSGKKVRMVRVQSKVVDLLTASGYEVTVNKAKGYTVYATAVKDNEEHEIFIPETVASAKKFITDILGLVL